jgi:hypothetical protein
MDMDDNPDGIANGLRKSIRNAREDMWLAKADLLDRRSHLVYEISVNSACTGIGFPPAVVMGWWSIIDGARANGYRKRIARRTMPKPRNFKEFTDYLFPAHSLPDKNKYFEDDRFKPFSLTSIKTKWNEYRGARRDYKQAKEEVWRSIEAYREVKNLANEY